MIAVLAVAGGLAEALAWALVARRRLSVWVGVGAVLAVMGAVALATGRVSLSSRAGLVAAGMVGAAAGAALYLATRAFAAVVAPAWPAFRRHAARIYEERGDLTLLATLGLAMAAVAGEELFWRGFVQGTVESDLGRFGGAAVAWLGYLAANATSANLAIGAGAVVGGAAWAGLALWSGGVLAGLLSHAVWTGLMIAFPVVRGGTSKVEA